LLKKPCILDKFVLRLATNLKRGQLCQPVDVLHPLHHAIHLGLQRSHCCVLRGLHIADRAAQLAEQLVLQLRELSLQRRNGCCAVVDNALPSDGQRIPGGH
jgi:hypothetical protein